VAGAGGAVGAAAAAGAGGAVGAAAAAGAGGAVGAAAAAGAGGAVAIRLAIYSLIRAASWASSIRSFEIAYSGSTESFSESTATSGSLASGS
jgi:hypothetical protein